MAGINESTCQMGKCTVCGKSSSLRCSHCKKVFYCSVDCQKSHRKEHKADCFPLILQKCVEGGKPLVCWVTTRDVRQGETVFSELPLVVGPSGSLGKDELLTVCLACQKIISQDRITDFNKCSKCHWPVCNVECEEDVRHSQSECKIFESKNVLPKNHFLEYDFIRYIRSLLLKFKNPLKWKQLLKMEPGPKSRAVIDQMAAELELEFAVHFIQTACGLKEFDSDVIKHVIKVYKTNEVGVISAMNTHSLSVLYYKISHISHSCVPNTKSIDLIDSKIPYGMKVVTTVPVKHGDRLSHSIIYGNCMDGTQPRRLVLMEQYNFSCTCERCRDPTELGSYMSALRCPAKGKGHCDVELMRHEGYLLPVSPLNENTVWKCNAQDCGAEFSNGVVFARLSPIAKEVKTLVDKADKASLDFNFGRSGLTVGVEEFQLLNSMEKYLEICEKSLHPNHYLIFQLKKKIVIGMCSVVSPVPQNVEFRQQRLEMIERMQELAEECVTVADIILPGLSLFRGKSLYFLGMSKWAFIMDNVTGGGSVDKTVMEMQEAGRITRLVEEIFEGSCLDSAETKLLQTLKVYENIATSVFASNPSFASKVI